MKNVYSLHVHCFPMYPIISLTLSNVVFLSNFINFYLHQTFVKNIDIKLLYAIHAANRRSNCQSTFIVDFTMVLYIFFLLLTDLKCQAII